MRLDEKNNEVELKIGEIRQSHQNSLKQHLNK